MTPRNNPGAFRVIICLADNVRNFSVGFGRNFVDYFAGKIAGSVESISHFLSAFCYCFENFRAVKILTPYDKPELIILQVQDEFLLCLLCFVRMIIVYSVRAFFVRADIIPAFFINQRKKR